MKLKDKEVQVARTLMCDALVELGYSRVLDLFMTVVDDLKTFEAPVVRSCKGPDEYVRELKEMVRQAERITHGKEKLAKLFLLRSEKEESALSQLDKIIQEIERRVQTPLTKLAARNLKPKELEPVYHKLAKGAGTAITKKLIVQHQVVRGRLGETSAKLRKLLAIHPRNKLHQMKESPVEMSCVSIDMARYSLLARQIQATQDAKALFDFNRKLQHQLRCALAAAGAKPDQVPIDDTGDGALVFLPDASTAVKFAVEVQKAGFVKNLGIPKKNGSSICASALIPER